MIGSKQTVESTENPKLLNEFCTIELSIVSCGNGVWRDVTQEVLWTFLEDEHEPSKGTYFEPKCAVVSIHCGF